MHLPEGTVCEARWLGQVDYDAAWQLQDRLAQEIAQGLRPPTLLLLEHPHVYTLGRRGRAENVLWSEQQRVERGITLRSVDRGGDVTYHGPGQLVGYPLLPLAPIGWAGTGQADSEPPRLPQADYVGYVRSLEKVLVIALARLGVVAGQRAGLTGVWVAADVWGRCARCDPAKKPAPAKIASIGVKVDVNGISRHGFALNVSTDPEYWEGIIPCGLDEVSMVNLSDLIQPLPGMNAVCQAVVEAFETVFRCPVHFRKGQAGQINGF